MENVLTLGQRVKAAAPLLACAQTDVKNRALFAIADRLVEFQDSILDANARDLAAGREAGLSESLLDRLALNPIRIAGIAEGLRQVAALPDPIGEVVEMSRRPNGLQIGKRRVPLGVIGIIYESRPNVTVDAAALTLKAGNAVLLRGGKEAIHSNVALVSLMRTCLADCGLPADLICLVEDTSRQSATDMMGLRGVLDVLIPRGGAGLIRSVVENAKVPVIETGWGNCHLYVDKAANLDSAVEILFNGKTTRPSVCNALETVLVDRAVAADFLPRAKARLDEKRVAWRGCPETITLLGDCVTPATEEDWLAEFGDFILACRVVSGLDEALAHIARYGSMHSECIITEDYTAAQRFLDEVDAAAVYVNASTRFTDGFEFGLGAEIGISTQKMHARGPMGLRELTTSKFVIYGNGQIR